MERIIDTTRTPEEHYAVLDEVLINVLRAGKAEVSADLMDHLHLYERCLKVALGLPVQVHG